MKDWFDLFNDDEYRESIVIPMLLQHYGRIKLLEIIETWQEILND